MEFVVMQNFVEFEQVVKKKLHTPTRKGVGGLVVSPSHYNLYLYDHYCYF